MSVESAQRFVLLPQPGRFFRLVRLGVRAFSVLSAGGLLAMVAITCADVILRAAGRPLTGSLDLIGMASVLVLAGALPHTTALKGHIAVDYFIDKLHGPWRIGVASIFHLLGMALFALLAWQFVFYGLALRRSGELTTTLRLPIFWMAWLISASCVLVVLVILHRLLHPRQELMSS